MAFREKVGLAIMLLGFSFLQNGNATEKVIAFVVVMVGWVAFTWNNKEL